MKKKIGFLALFIAILMCFFTVSAFAAGDENGNSQMPFVDSEEILPEFPDVQTETDIFEEFEEVFGEDSGAFVIAIIIGSLFSVLFFPAVIVIVIFAILLNNAKKELKEYERFFGPAPQINVNNQQGGHF